MRFNGRVFRGTQLIIMKSEKFFQWEMESHLSCFLSLNGIVAQQQSYDFSSPTDGMGSYPLHYNRQENGTKTHALFSFYFLLRQGRTL
jgi:hypothetical protein